MRQIGRFFGVVIALVLVAPVIAHVGSETSQSMKQASERQVTFVIEKMTCAMCPITVRKAMEKVNGVLSVVTNFDKRSAVVVFDTSKTNEAVIAKVSKDAGYPAVAENAKPSE